MAFYLAACGESKFDEQPPRLDENLPEQPGEKPEEVSSRNELYRPQIHYTPARNWINDPNGMVYADGIYHLYYQYNPQGHGWGNLSWGHATSSDLVHWSEKNVAIVRNEWGDIFSGCSILDKDNVAGFGKNTILAFYTASSDHQQQCLAYSSDGGMTFTQYEGNPVIKNTELSDFRDPKVFWHEESHRWVMCLALGWSCRIEFWGSENLKEWTKLSEFTSSSHRSNIGQWECPDLIRLPYEGGEKWVLIVSNNPGGPAGGSGTEYFIGDFDGTEFKAMELDYPLWLDYGADNYAGVTWSNLPGDRKVMIGWMNNWNYANDVPATPWCSAMTLPRELSLTKVNGTPLLATKVINELDDIAGEWKPATGGIIEANDAYELKFTINLNESSAFTLANNAGEYMEVEVNASAGKMIAKRTSSTGVSAFNNLFSIPSISAPFNTEDDTMELHIFVDRSSVEILNAEGTMAITNIVFPKEPYNIISGVENAEYRILDSIW